MLLKQKNRPLGILIQRFQAILIFVNAAINIIPQFKLLPSFNYIWLYSMLTWFLVIFFLRPSFFRKLPLLIKLMLFFVAYSIAIPYIMDNPTIGNRYISLAQIPFFYLAFYFNESSGNKKTNITIIKWTIPLILYASINTIIGLLRNPFSSRAGISNDVQKVDLLSQVSAGYDFTYFIVFISIVIYSILFFGNSVKISRFNRVLSFLILGTLVINILLANYFTALLMLLSSIAVFLIMKKFTIFKLLFFVPLILIVIFARVQILSYSIDFFEDISPNGMTFNRLKEIQRGIESQKSNDIAEVRESTLASSLKGFYENPLMGKVTTEFKIRDTYFSGFGQHSQFLDTLSLLGIIGFLQIYFVIKIFLERLRKKETNFNAFIVSILVSVLIVNIFNNTTALIGFAYFFIFPTAYSWLSDQQQQIKQKRNEERNKIRRIL